MSHSELQLDQQQPEQKQEALHPSNLTGLTVETTGQVKRQEDEKDQKQQQQEPHHQQQQEQEHGEPTQQPQQQEPPQQQEEKHQVDEQKQQQLKDLPPLPPPQEQQQQQVELQLTPAERKPEARPQQPPVQRPKTWQPEPKPKPPSVQPQQPRQPEAEAAAAVADVDGACAHGARLDRQGCLRPASFPLRLHMYNVVPGGVLQLLQCPPWPGLLLRGGQRL